MTRTRYLCLAAQTQSAKSKERATAANNKRHREGKINIAIEVKSTTNSCYWPLLHASQRPVKIHYWLLRHAITSLEWPRLL